MQSATAAAGALYGFWLTSKSAFADTHVFLNKNLFFKNKISIIIISSSSIFIIITFLSSIKDFLNVDKVVNIIYVKMYKHGEKILAKSGYKPNMI